MDFEHSRFSILTTRLPEFSTSPFTLSEQEESISLSNRPIVQSTFFPCGVQHDSGNTSAVNVVPIISCVCESRLIQFAPQSELSVNAPGSSCGCYCIASGPLRAMSPLSHSDTITATGTWPALGLGQEIIQKLCLL